MTIIKPTLTDDCMNYTTEQQKKDGKFGKEYSKTKVKNL